MKSSANLDDPRIAIVGSGAVGSYFGACLAEAGEDVHFLMRHDYSTVRTQGLSVAREHAPSFTLADVHGYLSTDQIGPCDLVIVALKSTDNESLLDLIPPLLHEGTVLLTLQNGLGNLEFLQKHFGDERVVGGIVFMGINRVAPGRIENYNPNGGTVTLGEPFIAATERIAKIRALMERAHIIPQVVDDFQMALWKKLVWNVPFNGLSIVANATTDVVLNSPHLLVMAQELMREIQAGAKCLRMDIPDSFVTNQVAYTRPLGCYKPSSMLDFRAGRPVEIESIWGEPYRRGTSAGASMPCLGMMYALIKTLVGNNAKRVFP